MAGKFEPRMTSGRRPRKAGFRCAARRGEYRCQEYTSHFHGGVQVCYSHWQALRESILRGIEKDAECKC